MKNVFALGWVGMLVSSLASAALLPVSPCSTHRGLQAMKSRELQRLFRADQRDRNPTVKKGTAKRDRERRERVATIFAEGCLRSADDYAAAALIFQHGNVPDHYFQAFLWAKRSVDLGNYAQKKLMVDGIDRYLIATGRKQLFGTQGFLGPGQKCWCLQPVESSFPDAVRQQVMGSDLEAQKNWINGMNAGHSACVQTQDVECKSNLKPSPAGTVPGLW